MSLRWLTLTFLFTATLLAAAGGGPGETAEPSFRRHALNPDSTYSACAAVDVNRDGKLDVVCGGWWYEAPHWKRHFLRDVEIIRGRFDDYSNLPFDVNGDVDRAVQRVVDLGHRAAEDGEMRRARRGRLAVQDGQP